MLNHGSLTFSSSASQALPASLRGELVVDLLRRAALDERRVHPGVEREPREALELGIRLEQEHVDAGDHLRDVLIRDVGQGALAEADERRVRAVAEQQELRVVLPHQLDVAMEASVCLEDLDVAGVAPVLVDHGVGLVLG